MTDREIAVSAAEKLRGSNYHISASGFRDVGFDELVDLFLLLLDMNKTKQDVAVLFESHPSTISMSRESQRSSCPDFNEECDCFLPSMKGGDIWCLRKRRERREASGRRNYPEYQEWRDKVFDRDNYTCQVCNQKGGELNAHHLKSYKKHEALRLDVSNGQTLCVSCHRVAHGSR